MHKILLKIYRKNHLTNTHNEQYYSSTLEMKIAYLILAHHRPAHLHKLVTALSSRSSSIFIHLDKKSNADDFSSITGDNIHFMPDRVAVFWSDYSQVEAILILIKTAFASSNTFDRFVLLSGVDYPLRSTAYIESFFANNRDNEYIHLDDAASKLILRLTRYRFRPLHSKISRIIGYEIIRHLLFRIVRKLYQRDYKTHLGGLTPYGGAEWWALSRQSCDYILNFVARETRFVTFYKNTECPDEMFFQTILGNSVFRTKIVSNLTYTDWSAGGLHPADLTEKHLALFGTMVPFVANDTDGIGEKLFARKFSDGSDDLVTQLEHQIKEKETEEHVLMRRFKSTTEL